MIKIKKLRIKTEKDYEKLNKHVPRHLIDTDVIDCLKGYIGKKCDTIKIEFPYYDSDYLSTYYEHYAQKFKQYGKTCCRLHIEAGNIYYGYITLRPGVRGAKIGKTYLSPRLLLKHDAYLMLGNFEAHTLGQTLHIHCFPWKKQQTDISVCAHTAVWTILRYYGTKYAHYADVTIGDIVSKIENDWGRKTPSLGLDPVQVSDLLKSCGFSPLIVSREKSNSSMFYDEILAYVESGIPMIGFLTSQCHAMSIIGHGMVDYNALSASEMLMDKENSIISHTKLIQSIYVMDDRYFPYREVPVMLPDKDSDVQYGINELSYVVIPLYSRMQLTYREIYNRMVSWIKAKVMQWETCNVYRIYITSANSLRKRAFDSTTMPQELKDVILTASLPKFVWCIDLAGIENYKQGKTSGRIIIDTTSATLDSEPWIIRHDMQAIQYKDYDKNTKNIYEVKIAMKPYEVYENNLLHFTKEG